MEIIPDKTRQPVPKLALSRREAAQAIGVSAVTIDRLTTRGLLNPSRATRRPLYPVTEIERFLRETTNEIGKEVA
ncbi:MAG: helix-turn-helix domain-containing protein [Verrucomicrobiales bacterium]|nr:helix-turn-helix domain-containing protein [Verrucomicrobiales bacterium]